MVFIVLFLSRIGFIRLFLPGLFVIVFCFLGSLTCRISRWLFRRIVLVIVLFGIVWGSIPAVPDRHKQYDLFGHRTGLLVLNIKSNTVCDTLLILWYSKRNAILAIHTVEPVRHQIPLFRLYRYRIQIIFSFFCSYDLVHFRRYRKRNDRKWYGYAALVVAIVLRRDQKGCLLFICSKLHIILCYDNKLLLF